MYVRVHVVDEEALPPGLLFVVCCLLFVVCFWNRAIQCELAACGIGAANAILIRYTTAMGDPSILAHAFQRL